MAYCFIRGYCLFLAAGLPGTFPDFEEVEEVVVTCIAYYFWTTE